MTFKQHVYNGNYGQPQQTNCWCVTASARALLKYIPGSAVYSQTTIDSYIKQHNFFDWTDDDFSGYKRCIKGNPSPSYANDSRGLAWALWNYNDNGFGFREYHLPGQSGMNWKIVLGVRSTYDPVPVTVKSGKHEILVVGYETEFDPKYGAYGDAGNSIVGFFIWDPWYDTGWTWSGWGGGDGYVGNSYIAISDWNQNIFKKDVWEGTDAEGAPWYDHYVAVLRSVESSNPGINDGDSYGDWWYEQYGQASASMASSEALATESDASTERASLASAVADGLVANDLLYDRDFGSISSDYSIGTALHVESLDPSTPSYELVEIRSGSDVAAIALVNDGTDGYWFGSLHAVTKGMSLPSQIELDSAVVAAGLKGPGRLVWGDTEEGAPRQFPFLVGNDSSGRLAFAEPMTVTPEFLLR